MCLENCENTIHFRMIAEVSKMQFLYIGKYHHPGEKSKYVHGGSAGHKKHAHR
jgi:hypothetical protein